MAPEQSAALEIHLRISWLSVWSSLRCIDGEETAASKLKGMQLAHQIILKTLTH
jgi:hypothetical protein